MRYLGIERPLPPEVLAIVRSVRRWAFVHGRGIMAGQCGDASTELVRRLFGVGFRSYVDNRDFCVNPELDHWQGHAVVMFKRCVLDVTADQFNDLLDIHGQSIRMGSIVFGSISELDNRYAR